MDAPTMPTPDHDGAEKLAWIDAQIAAGRTVLVATATKVWRFTPAYFARMRTAGYRPFKVGRKGDLLMLTHFTRGGTVYDSATYCGLRVEEK